MELDKLKNKKEAIKKDPALTDEQKKKQINALVIGEGYKVEDIENVVLNVSNGVPTLIKNVAKVSVGHVPRLGIVGKDFEDDVDDSDDVYGY